MINTKLQGLMVARLAGWATFHAIRIRLMDDDGDNYTDYFGVQIGPWSVLWTNPFKGD